ncbi:hypothetical protein NL676_033563 [Syzygium grande]|nr:hypothetical protein NL676_033563 [Syzygium grande]
MSGKRKLESWERSSGMSWLRNEKGVSSINGVKWVEDEMRSGGNANVNLNASGGWSEPDRRVVGACGSLYTVFWARSVCVLAPGFFEVFGIGDLVPAVSTPGPPGPRRFPPRGRLTPDDGENRRGKMAAVPAVLTWG